jgi:hypothetical protein
MPRVYDSGNDALDFCLRHFPNDEIAERRYGNVAKTGVGPDGRGNCYARDAEHPDYGGEDYRCHTCKKHLTEDDN